MRATPPIYDLAMLGRLGRAAARWRYVILGVWAAVALAGAVFGGGVYDRTESVEGARGESGRAQERLDELAPEGETVVAIISGEDFFSTALIESATNVMYAIRELPGVKEVRDAYTAGGLIGDDKQSSLAVVELDPGLDEDAALAAADRVAAEAAHDPSARGTGRRQAARRAHVRRAGNRGRRARRGDRARRPARRARAVQRRPARRRAPAARRAGDDRGLIAGTQRARERDRGQRVRRQRRHAARARARRRLQPAGGRPLPRGARRGPRGADAGAAGADGRRRRPRGARLRAGGRDRARGALRLRRPAALGHGAGRRAGGRHGDGRRPDLRARAGRGRAPAHPGAGDAHLGLAARAGTAPDSWPGSPRSPSAARRWWR